MTDLLQIFLCKDINLKGTVEKILKEIQLVIFEKKLKEHLSQKLHLERLRKPLLHFWARNPLSLIWVYTQIKARRESILMWYTEEVLEKK